MSKLLHVILDNVHAAVAEVNRHGWTDRVVFMSGTDRRFLIIVRTEDDDAPLSLLGVPLGEAAHNVLRHAGRPMKSRDILSEVVRRGYESQREGGTVPGAISYALSLRARAKGDVEQCGRGLWRCKQMASGSTQP